ncbi:RecB family exonuclease [Actinoplanes sp. CA-054009]
MTSDTPEEQEPKQRRRSVSQLTSFTRCGESYRLERREKAPTLPAAWFAQGIGFHGAAESYEKALGDMSPDAAVRLYEDFYDEEIRKGLLIEPDKTKWLTGGRTNGAVDIERRRERGAEQLRGYIQYMSTAPEEVLLEDPWTPAVEHEFELDLDGVIVKGFIDQIISWPGGMIGPRDLKTGSKKPDWAIQLAVYKLAIEQDFAVSVSWGDFYMAKNNAPEKAVNLDRYTKDYLTRLFHDMHKAEEQGIYLPNPGDACRTCGVARFCTAVGDRFTVYPLVKEEDPPWD